MEKIILWRLPQYDIIVSSDIVGAKQKKGMIVMKNKKVVMITVFMLLIASLSITSINAEAKAKAYKAKTVNVTKGKSKTVTTSKKIKKVAIVSKNKNFTATKTGDKTFKVSGTDKGKTQTVKVTYTNKYTQKFKIKTVAAKIPSYAQKIVDELKPLLADPDKGLQTVLTQWEKKLGGTYEFKILNSYKDNTSSEMTIEDVMKNYTASEKKALILEVYFRTRMTYSKADKGKYHGNRNSNTYFKKLYDGTFKGVCADGAEMGYDICQYLGLKSKCTGSMEMNHGWCVIYVTDKNGVSYWHGIYTTAHSYNLKGTASVPNSWTMTKAQFVKYQYNPDTTEIIKRKVTAVKTATPKPAVATQAPVTTAAPVQTPAPTKAPTPAPTQTTTTIVFNTPEPYETETPVATTEPTKAPVATQAPTQTPVVTPEPTVEPTPAPTETPAPQRVVIPYNEHGYTCPGCNVTPYRHKNNNNPYISNFTKLYGIYTVYAHNCNGIIRYFDADGNEYIDISGDGDIMDELIQLAG